MQRMLGKVRGHLWTSLINTNKTREWSGLKMDQILAPFVCHTPPHKKIESGKIRAKKMILIVCSLLWGVLYLHNQYRLTGHLSDIYSHLPRLGKSCQLVRGIPWATGWRPRRKPFRNILSNLEKNKILNIFHISKIDFATVTTFKYAGYMFHTTSGASQSGPPSTYLNVVPYFI